MHKQLLKKLTDLGYDKSHFSLYSNHAGGATAAAANAGVPDRFFMRHGRWKSESAKDGYMTLWNRPSNIVSAHSLTRL